MATDAANTTSLAETSTKLVFPVEAEVRNKIPLWMKFYCYEYASTAISRASAYSRSGGGKSIFGTTREKAQIFVPAPVNFTSQTAHNYTNQPSRATELFNPLVAEIAKGVIDMIPGGEKLVDAYAAVSQALQAIDKATGYLSPMGGSQLPDPGEIYDSTYTPSGASRTHEVRMNLPCLSERDSMAAGAIIRAFEALSLPTVRSLFGISTKYYHPPLWVFGIGPPDSFKFDPDWTGSPQLSVLRSISHKKTAFDTNSLSAFGYGGLLKPVAYTVSLVFQELEPAFRQTNPGKSGVGLNIINRSTAISTTGTTIPAKVTGG